MENTTITFNEMGMIIKDFLHNTYSINEMPKYCFNGRLGKRTMGQYWYAGQKENTIEIAKKFNDIESAIGTLLHEVVHYAFHKLGKKWHDGGFEFEKELIKFELPTNYRRSYFLKKFNITYGELQCEHFVKDMVEYYANIIKEQRKNPQTTIVEKVANKKPSIVVKDGVKLEKTKISTMLHEFKMDNLIKGTDEYKLFTTIVDDIDNTPAKEKEVIINIYETFLKAYINDRHTYGIVNQGLHDVILLINSKVCNKYINDTISGFAQEGQL